MLLHAALVRLQLVQLLFQGLQTAAPFGQPARIALEAQVAVPGLDGVHQLAAVFHGHGFVEQDDRVAGRQFVGAAQVFEGAVAVVLAAGRRAALEVGGRIVEQQAGRHRSGGDQPVENVDGRIEFFFQNVGARLQLQPVGVFGSVLELALDAGPRLEQAGGLAACAEPPRRWVCGVTSAKPAPGMRRSKMRECV